METKIALSPVMSVTAVASLLGVSRRHVYNLIDRGEVPCVRLGGRILLSTTWVNRLLGRADEVQEARR